MSEEARMIMCALQSAVYEEMERKAKLGYKAVVSESKGSVKLVSARTLVRRMREAGLVSAH